MKRVMVMLVAIGLFSAMPAFADHKKGENTAAGQETSATHNHQDEDCARECDLLLKECAKEVDSIQQRVKKIKAAIKKDGAKPENREELKVLNQKLKETNETIRSLSKPGK
jgi:peptidoglycan hydrolase CwlO-like protein